MNQNIEFKAIPGQFNIDEAQGMVECFVAGIGNKDSVGDVLISGAFTKSLTRRKPRVVWGHNWNDPIGKVLEIYEVAPGDRRLPSKMLTAGIGGLYAKVQFNLGSEKGREAFANVAFFGQEQEWSIGYKTLDSIFDPNIQANILKEVELYEVSPVLHGANQLTGTISVKSDDSTIIDDSKGGILMLQGNRGPMVGKPTGMMPHRYQKPTPNILEANKPGVGDERKNQLEIELAVRAGAPVKVRLAEENTVIFDRMTPDGAPTTYRVAYHYTGREFMFGKPEKVSVQTVYMPSSEESGSRVVVPSQMPSMPMQVKPQGNAYMGDDMGEAGMIMPKSYENDEKWSFDEDFADLANIISDSLDVKVGRALSGKNMSRLKAILENLQEVIASAEKDVEVKSDYVIPVPIENAFQTKQLLDPIFDYHRVESHVTEDGIVVTSGVTSEFIEAISVAEKALGRTLSGGLGKLGRAARGAARFDPNAWDGDGDGLVQEGTPFKRPAIPGVNDRSTGGRVNAAAATRAFNEEGKTPTPKEPKRQGLASYRGLSPREQDHEEWFEDRTNEELARAFFHYSGGEPGSRVGTTMLDAVRSDEKLLDDIVESAEGLRKFYQDDLEFDLENSKEVLDILNLKDKTKMKEKLTELANGTEKDSDILAGLLEQYGVAVNEKYEGVVSKAGLEKVFDDEVYDFFSERTWENPDSWNPESIFAKKRRSGLASTSVEKKPEVLKGEIVSGPGSRSVSDKFIDRSGIPDKHADILKSIISNLDDDEEMLSETRKNFLNAIKNGDFDDYLNLQSSERNFDRYISDDVGMALTDAVRAMLTERMMPKNASRKQEDKINELIEETVDEWSDSVFKTARRLSANKPPTDKEIQDAKKESSQKKENLIQALQSGELDMDEQDFEQDFWFEVGDILELDPSIDLEDFSKELQRATQKGFEKNPNDPQINSLWENYFKNGLNQGVMDELEDTRLNSEFLQERVRAKRTLTGGLASTSRRGDGTMLGRDGQIQRDERGNVDPTEARERRAQFDQNVFKKLRELGLSDDEIEQLTGVPDGGVVREGGKPAQYVPDDIRRGGLASQSRASTRGERNLQRPVRTVSEDGTQIPDNDIFRDFLSGMSAKEIAEKYNLSGERVAKSSANREFRRLSQNSESGANSDMDLLMYRASGLSVRDTAELFGMSPREVRKTERRLTAKLRKENDENDLLYLRSGLTLEQTGELLKMEPSKLRQREVGITRKKRQERQDREGRSGLASSSNFDDDTDYDEAFGPRNPGARRGMADDPVGDAASENIDRGRNARAVREGLASESRQMDMTLEEYGKLQNVLEKYLDDSQVGGVGSDEDMEVLKNIIDKIDDSSVANDAIPMNDDEIDSYIDTLTRMNNFGAVDSEGDKKAINELIDSLKKTKKSKDGYYSTEALEQSGTRLSGQAGARRIKKTRPFSSQSGTTNPHKKLDIELTEDEIGSLRDEVELLSRTAENKNILKAVSEKLEKSNNGKFSIDDNEYEDLIKAIEQSKSRSGMVSSDLLGVLEQAAESSDGEYSSLNIRGGGLASTNKGRKPNNGAPADITEAMQKDYIFWARSGKANNLQLVQDALRDFEADDGQLAASKWKRLRTMYQNFGPGSASGSGRRGRVGLASSGGFGDNDKERRTARPGGIGARGLGDVGLSANERGDFGTGRGSTMGAENTKFDGLSLDEAKPDNWDELTNDEKFEWLMYEGNPEKVKDKNEKMSQAAYQGAIKKVTEDMEREERRSMTPEQRRARRNEEREEQAREISPREIERQGDARKKRQQEKEKTQGSQKTYKPKASAEEGREQREEELQSYQEKIQDIKNKLNELDFDGEIDIVSEDIWETVNDLLGDRDMTKKSINDAIEALEDYIETNSPGENKYEKLSVSSANRLLGQLSKTQAKYAEDPWIIDDLPRSGGLASRSRSRDADRPRPGTREMPQSNAKRENEMKKISDLARQVIEEMRSKQEADKGKRSRVGLASTSRPKAMITDEATFFKDVETSLQKEIRAAQKAKNKKAENGLSKLQEVIRRNEASKTGDRRTNVGSIYLTDDEADLVLEGLMFALDNQIEIGGDKRIEWYSKLLEKVSQAAMSTFINKN
jgi:HK97 family phage prohead protease